MLDYWRKPLIRKHAETGYWLCVGVAVYGSGWTPLDAYYSWVQRTMDADLQARRLINKQRR